MCCVTCAPRFDMAEGFFTPAVRARVVAFILQRKFFVEHDPEHESPTDFGIDKLLADKTYLASYAAHEVSARDVTGRVQEERHGAAGRFRGGAVWVAPEARGCVPKSSHKLGMVQQS